MAHILKKTTLGQQTANILRERIINGYYSQGGRLIEEELASEFEVSRATIREALRLLESEGILVREINRFTYIRELSDKDVKSLFAMRNLLESESVRYCVEHNCIPESELRMYVEEMKRSTKEGHDEWNCFMQADIGFHEAIIREMDNVYAMKFWKMMKSQYLMAIYMIRAWEPAAFFGTSEEHVVLLEALLKGDAEPWLKHLRQIKQDVERMLSERSAGKDS